MNKIEILQILASGADQYIIVNPDTEDINFMSEALVSNTDEDEKYIIISNNLGVAREYIEAVTSMNDILMDLGEFPATAWARKNAYLNLASEKGVNKVYLLMEQDWNEEMSYGALVDIEAVIKSIECDIDNIMMENPIMRFSGI